MLAHGPFVDVFEMCLVAENAIASWGKPHDFNNGTSGNFPRYTRMEGNWASELGVIQKQSSFYFQAETAQPVIRNNVVYNIPRGEWDESWKQIKSYRI